MNQHLAEDINLSQRHQTRGSSFPKLNILSPSHCACPYPVCLHERNLSLSPQIQYRVDQTGQTFRLIKIQYSPFIMLCLGSIGIDCVISESCYNGTILQRNYRKMTILWSFSYNSFVNFHGTKNWEPEHDCVISNLHYNEVRYKGSAL